MISVFQSYQWRLSQKTKQNTLLYLSQAIASTIYLTQCWVCHSQPDSPDHDLITFPLNLAAKPTRNNRGWSQGPPVITFWWLPYPVLRHSTGQANATQCVVWINMTDWLDCSLEALQDNYSNWAGKPMACHLTRRSYWRDCQPLPSGLWFPLGRP